MTAALTQTRRATAMTERTEYRLTSNGLCCTPGVVRWAQNGAKFETDRPHIAKVVACLYPHLPWLAVEKLLDGDCVIDDATETVTVSLELPVGGDYPDEVTTGAFDDAQLNKERATPAPIPPAAAKAYSATDPAPVRCKACNTDIATVDGFHTVPGWKGVFCDGCWPAPGSTNLAWHELVAEALTTAGKCVEEMVATSRAYYDAGDGDTVFVSMTKADAETIRRTYTHAHRPAEEM